MIQLDINAARCQHAYYLPSKSLLGTHDFAQQSPPSQLQSAVFRSVSQKPFPRRVVPLTTVSSHTPVEITAIILAQYSAYEVRYMMAHCEGLVGLGTCLGHIESQFLKDASKDIILLCFADLYVKVS